MLHARPTYPPGTKSIAFVRANHPGTVPWHSSRSHLGHRTTARNFAQNLGTGARADADPCPRPAGYKPAALRVPAGRRAERRESSQRPQYGNPGTLSPTEYTPRCPSVPWAVMYSVL